jgi:hypothetical protein
MFLLARSSTRTTTSSSTRTNEQTHRREQCYLVPGTSTTLREHQTLSLKVGSQTVEHQIIKTRS